MIKTLRQAVFLRLTLFFCLGIFIQAQKNFYPFWIYLVVLSLLILGFSFLPKINSSYPLRWLFGAGLSLLCISSAGIITHINWKQSEWAEDVGMKTYKVQLIDEPELKPKTWMCRVKTGDKNLIIYIPIDSISSSLNPYDQLLIKARFEKVEDYMRRKGIAARAFIAKNNWEKLKNQPKQPFNVHHYSLKCRRIVLNRLKMMLPNAQLFSLAAGISFGYVREMDKETRQAFAVTGCAHILSVSGLHFAILYSTLTFIFSFLGNKKQGRIIRQLIILPFLWTFAFFTGMPPAVTRSVIMITIWGLGSTFFIQALTVNTLGSAAFFMLLYNPFNLYDIGFQLSFCAVLAILLINPYLTSLYQSRNPILKYLWELSCTSTSAQIGTAPLSIYYFNQFPLLYLFSNIFAIPVTGILMLLIPISLSISFIFGVHLELMFPLQKILEIFIKVLNALADVPQGVITDIQLTINDAISLTLGIIFFFLFLIKKRMIYLCLLIILFLFQVFYYLCPS